MATLPSGYLVHNNFIWGRDGSGPYAMLADGQLVELGGGGTASAVEDRTEAELALEPPSAENLNVEYQITDRRGGTRVKSNGVSWVEQSPAINDLSGIPAAAWADRGSGTTDDLIYITDASWNRRARFRHNGTAYTPDGDQVIYNVDTPLSNSGTNTASTVNFPNITLPGGILGTSGGFRIEVYTVLNIAPTGSTDSLTLGGTAFRANTADAANRRRRWITEVINLGADNAQLVTVRSAAGEYGAPGTFGTDPTELSKNSAGDLVIAGSSAHTFSSAAFVHRVLRYRVTLLGG